MVNIVLRITPSKINCLRLQSRQKCCVFFSIKFLNTFMAVGLIISKTGRGRRSDGSGHGEIVYNSLKCSLLLYILLNLTVY